MKLYVLERIDDYEPNAFVGVYATKELAREGLRIAYLEVIKESILRKIRKGDNEYDIESLEAFTECFYEDDEDCAECVVVKVYHKGKFCGGSECYEIRGLKLNDTDAGEVY